jgi:hypothetical protein
MRMGFVIIAAAMAVLPACGGPIDTNPQDYYTYGFKSEVQVATLNPAPGHRVDFTVAVTSTGNTPVHCDVILHVVSHEGEEIFTQRWDDMLFMPQAQWDMSNGFLPSTDVPAQSYKLQLEVRRHDTGELLQQNFDAGELDLAKS